jgi:DNA-binding transcriptional LysR family regulator
LKRLKELDLQLLVVFDALCRTGSVTRAADQLGHTQGAVSQSLKRLRMLFDDELFVRTKKGLVRTQRGQELTHPVAELLAKAEAILISQAGFDPESAKRTATLSMLDIGDVAIVPTLLARMRQEAPGCTVMTVPVDGPTLPQAMADGEVDLLISSQTFSSSQIMRQRLYTHRYTLLASHDSKLPGRIDIKDYCSLDHVSVLGTGNARSSLDEALEERGLSRRIVAQSTHCLVMPYWIEADPTLVATVPSLLADLCLRRGSFRVIDVVGGLPHFDIFQFWHQRFDNDKFNNWLRRTVRGAFMRHGTFDLPAQAAEHAH